MKRSFEGTKDLGNTQRPCKVECRLKIFYRTQLCCVQPLHIRHLQCYCSCMMHCKLSTFLCPAILFVFWPGNEQRGALHHIIFQGHICISSGQPFPLLDLCAALSEMSCQLKNYKHHSTLSPWLKVPCVILCTVPPSSPVPLFLYHYVVKQMGTVELKPSKLN